MFMDGSGLLTISQCFRLKDCGVAWHSAFDGMELKLLAVIRF